MWDYHIRIFVRKANEHSNNLVIISALADLNLAIIGSRSKHLTVPAEAEAQHSSLHQHKVVLGMATKVENATEGLGGRKVTH